MSSDIQIYHNAELFGVLGTWYMRGEIVREVLKDSLLAQEGITAGTIQAGAFLTEYDVYTVKYKRHSR